MEIALVSLFDAAAAEPLQGQTPEEPFRDFLGAAVARDPEAGELPTEGEPAADTDPEREDATSPAPLPDTPTADAVSSLEWSPSTATSAEFIPEETVAAPPVPQELPAVAATPEYSSSAPVSSKPPAETPGRPETDSPSAATHPTTEALPVSEFADHETAPETAPEPALATADPAVPQAVPIPIHGAPVVAVAAADDTLMQTAVAPPLPTGAVSAVARETSPQQRSRSELARTRAADEFQGRAGADRLWGYWLRNRGAGPARPASAVASGAEQGVAPGGEGLPRGAGNEPGWSQIVRLVNPAGELPVETRSANPGEAVPHTGELRTEPATSSVNPGTQAGAGTEPTAGVRTTTPVVRQSATPPPPAPQQVANAVRVAVFKGGDRITVQLQPETLGKVQVVLVRGDEGLSASFKVENPVTHQALQADAPMLRQALEARGVNVLHVSVELEQGDRQNRDPLARHGGGRKRRFLGAEQQGELPLDDIALRPQPWRPWGFDARA